MKFKKCGFVVGFCLLATRIVVGDPLISFAQESLGLNLASIPFGQLAETNNGFGLASKPFKPQMIQQDLVDESGVTWSTNSLSAKYHQDHPDRLLRFAVRKSRIVGIRVSIDSCGMGGFMPPSGMVEQTRKELRQIEAELHKLWEAGKAAPKSPRVFDLRTGFMCGPGESLFLMELQITPVGTLSSPDAAKKSGGI